MQRAGLAFVLLCFAATSARAQAAKSIDPGMSQAQVVERLGDPTLSRSAGDFTYLFYKNGCVKLCGMDDVVILHKDSVVDAMFRSPERAYTGKSSSPKAIPADVAARTRPAVRDAAAPAAVQSGEPRAEAAKPDSTAKPDTTPKRDSATERDSVASKPAAAKPVRRHKAAKLTPPASQPDSAERDSIMKGSLRIKVMPKNFVPPKDSARRDTLTKRPQHSD